MPKKKKKSKLNKFIKKMRQNKLKFNLSEVIIIVIISIMLGALIGGSITYKKENVTITKVPSELKEFVDTYNNINENYYKKVNKKKLIDSSIAAMINSLDDPYSIYMNETDTEEFNEKVNGKYVGIGASIIKKNNKVEIYSIFNNSPAKKKGLKIGDQIISIDNKNIKNKTITEITELVKGRINTSITLKVLRDNKKYTFKIKRTNVDLSSVSSKIIEKDSKKIGYITISIFASNTYKQFKKELEKNESNKIDSLIIDVRSNPGGHLEQVTKILELFLNKSKVLYQIKTHNNIRKIYSSTKENRKYNITVLINKNSASASEILAAAIKESYKGNIVGVNSYGKGTVQKTYELTDGTSLKYTTKKWLTPKGNWINKKGVTPNEIVELSDEYKNNPIEENDNQLQKAIELSIKEKD